MLALTAAPATAVPDAAPAILPTAPADEVAAPPKLTVADLIDPPKDNPATSTVKGKSLLKDLGDALIAINDALEAGKPVDPALEQKLSQSLDAIATYVGALTQPAPAIDPRIVALATGDATLPAKPQPQAPIDPTAPVDDSAASIVPVDEGATPALTVVTPGGTSDYSVGTPSTGQNNGNSPGTGSMLDRMLARRTTGLSRLADLVEDISSKLEAQSPQLAQKLDALVDRLRPAPAAAPAGAPTGFALSTTAADPEITRIVDELSKTKPKPLAAQPSAPFTTPKLDLPPAAAGKAAAAAADPAPAAPTDTPLAPPDDAAKSGVVTTDTTISRPAAATHATADVTTPDTGNKPADAAPASPATNATTSPTSADNAQPPAAPPLQAAPVARTALAAYQTPVQQVNLPQVAFELVRQFDAGNTRFQIRLDPPELGRIDVKLDVDKSGTVNARMTVERPETLDLMQRDQRALQQALQQAGLDAGKTNLEFSLRQNPFAQQGGMAGGHGNQPGYAGGNATPGSDDASADVAVNIYRGTASASGVNLFV